MDKKHGHTGVSHRWAHIGITQIVFCDEPVQRVEGAEKPGYLDVAAGCQQLFRAGVAGIADDEFHVVGAFVAHVGHGGPTHGKAVEYYAYIAAEALFQQLYPFETVHGFQIIIADEVPAGHPRGHMIVAENIDAPAEIIPGEGPGGVGVVGAVAVDDVADGFAPLAACAIIKAVEGIAPVRGHC